LQINDGLFAGVAANLYVLAGISISGNSELAGKLQVEKPCPLLSVETTRMNFSIAFGSSPRSDADCRQCPVTGS
jgi:predicted kinase